MNILKLDYQGLPVHANREAWFNATQIAAMFGRRPIDWLRLPETERYIRALCKREAEKQGKSEVRKSHFVKTKKGGDLSQPEIQGTWLHPKLAVAFARWCDIDFALWCDEQIEALITDGQVWHAERTKSSIAHQVMTEILRSKRQAEGKATLPHHYGNEALLCNAALIGSGLSYSERKAALFDMAASYRHHTSHAGFEIARGQGALQ